MCDFSPILQDFPGVLIDNVQLTSAAIAGLRVILRFRLKITCERTGRYFANWALAPEIAPAAKYRATVAFEDEA